MRVFSLQAGNNRRHPRPPHPNPSPTRGGRGWGGGSLALLALAAVLASGCGNGHEKAGPAKSPEVIVTTPITDEVIDYQDFTGRLSAIGTVEIRARATGYLTQAIPQSREGQLVAKDEQLFVVDPRPYQVKLDQAVAQLESAKATAARARSLYERAYALLGKKAGFQEDV